MKPPIAKDGAGAGALMAFGAIWSAQLAGGLTVALSDGASVEDMTWVRLVWASLILIPIVRPWRLTYNRSTILICGLLGTVSAAMMMLYVMSIDRLPLGTSTALMFLGPLALAVVRASKSGKWWAVVAALGVVALTEPWQGGADPYGVLYALGGGLSWALYILLSQRAGDSVGGLHVLAISFPVAAIVTTGAVGGAVVTRIPVEMIFNGFVLAILLPVLPYIMELAALRRMTASSFGILMSLQPAVAVVIGIVVLGQVPKPNMLAGILLVLAAGVGATRNGGRRAKPQTLPTTDTEASYQTGGIHGREDLRKR
ncbi:membrane protein [Pseudarthrobacter scleromae]|uniref:Membrane protein n=1 Tax=Pseudarthrobacter scleromae TaxID=158897 RepID=A0ABQ2CEY8_9MICC|nr:membrane protein [Pseudarthrobacter scleromae]